jgi:nicotinate phosphoribosyltransferase
MARDEPGRIALAVDLYELTMGATYLALGMDETATFSLFVRRLPPRRAYLVAAGLQDALSRLSNLAFDEATAPLLLETGRFRREEVSRLLETRFTGDVWAVREGRAVFGDEPLLEVQAPLTQAQLVETALLNALHYPTVIASKAARCVAAARGKPVIDFGVRRMPGIDASVVAARACHLAGFAATSNLLAGCELGIPLSGTVAHSLIEVFTSELEGFRAYGRTATGGITLLVDTYDSLGGIAHAVQVARELAVTGRRVEAIRLDSGDLAELARVARRTLDESGLRQVRILASGGLDEYELARLARASAPIDAFALGTRVGMSADAPLLDMAYKIVAYADRPCLKLSEGKASLVGPKQVWRRRGAGGRFVEDRIAARDEPRPGAEWEALLAPVMRQGKALIAPTLGELRAQHVDEMRSMPPELLEPEASAAYPVRVSETLAQRQRAAIETVRERESVR